MLLHSESSLDVRRFLTLLISSTLLALSGCGAGSTAGSSSAALPEVSGAYGSPPTMSFPSERPPAQRQVKVLHQGSGDIVSPDDLVVVDYVGQFWNGEVFDDSFTRAQPNGFAVTEDSFFPGFAESITGAKENSRVVMVMPPPEGAMEGSGTLVFVIDVVRTYAPGTAGHRDALPQMTTDLPIKVTGELGTAPVLDLPPGLPEPVSNSVLVLAAGRGAPVVEGLVVVQYTVVDWTGKTVQSTWTQGTPSSAVVGDEQSPGLLSSLEGLPVGSRVLLQLPAPPDAESQAGAVAAVVDIVDQPAKATQVAQG